MLLSLFLDLFLLEDLYLLSAVGQELEAAHEWLEHLWYLNTLWSLVVFQNAAHCAFSGAESCIEHVHEDLVLALLLLSELQTDVKSS